MCACAGAVAHPKPGAHADVRYSIESDRVRVEALMNLRFVEGLVNFPRSDRDDIAAAEEAPLFDALAEYFGSARPASRGISAVVDRANVVNVDGLPVAPVIASIGIVRPAPEDRPGFEQNPLLLLPQVHAIIDYPFKTDPVSVAMIWGTYPRDFTTPRERDLSAMSDISAVLIARGDLTLLTFTPREPEYVWHRPDDGPRRPGIDAIARETVYARPQESSRLRVPLVPLGLGVAGVLSVIGSLFVNRVGVGLSARARFPARRGHLRIAGALALVAGAVTWPLEQSEWRQAPGAAPRPTDAEALRVFAPLHANIYRAFDYTREGDIYDALARSIDGALLDQVYGEVYRSLVMQEEGGALSRVRAVHPLETTIATTLPASEPAGFTVRAAWSVEGVVYHWGHSHERTTAYDAEFDVAPRESGWRIVAHRPLAQRRMETPEQAASPAAVNAPRAVPHTSTPPPDPTWRPNR